MNSRTLGFAGVVLLAVGVFLPIVELGGVQSMDYFQKGKGDGLLVLGCAGLAAVLLFAGAAHRLWIPSLAALGLCAHTWFRLKSEIDGMRRQLGPLAEMFDGMLGGSGGLLSMGWGWWVLFAGGILLFLSFLRGGAEAIGGPGARRYVPLHPERTMPRPPPEPVSSLERGTPLRRHDEPR
jgi:hypothetical protein